jgi:hypothetical protein
VENSWDATIKKRRRRQGNVLKRIHVKIIYVIRMRINKSETINAYYEKELMRENL